MDHLVLQILIKTHEGFIITVSRVLLVCCWLVSLFNMILMWLTVDCKAFKETIYLRIKLTAGEDLCDAVPLQTGTVGPA